MIISIIEKNITTLKQLDNASAFYDALNNQIIGKIMMAIELELMTWKQAEPYIDMLLKG